MILTNAKLLYIIEVMLPWLHTNNNVWLGSMHEIASADSVHQYTWQYTSHTHYTFRTCICAWKKLSYYNTSILKFFCSNRPYEVPLHCNSKFFTRKCACKLYVWNDQRILEFSMFIYMWRFCWLYDKVVAGGHQWLMLNSSSYLYLYVVTL